MSQYAIKWSVKEDAIEEPYQESREVLLQQVANETDAPNEIDNKSPKRELSSGLDEVIAIGIQMSANTQLFKQIYKTVFNNPNAIIEYISYNGEEVVFETPLDFNIEFSPEVNIELLFEYKNRKVWKAPEYPEELREQDRRQLLKKINENQEEEYTYEEFYEEDES